MRGTAVRKIALTSSALVGVKTGSREVKRFRVALTTRTIEKRLTVNGLAAVEPSLDSGSPLFRR